MISATSPLFIQKVGMDVFWSALSLIKSIRGSDIAIREINKSHLHFQQSDCKCQHGHYQTESLVYWNYKAPQIEDQYSSKYS